MRDWLLHLVKASIQLFYAVLSVLAPVTTLRDNTCSMHNDMKNYTSFRSYVMFSNHNPS